ncbi:ATP-binding cassette domain-containing protein [Roseovarius sp. ZX-A-9]|uniref:ATP-binding cassette domain-containing protein n=1 Tax=Roseovarius sp. ZX-A-9 TaxID=3014783 RepID=UPI0023314D65|nr:ATP-binding cassette domain-containing protein [Roseovarius sp. ZX-A-9]MDX1785377.1 ATP-binding cassette domain-containing protein [Roseovarius sp.]
MVVSLFPLTTQGAMVRRRGNVLIGPVDLTLSGQGVTVVIGPNGAGKSSLLQMLYGLSRLSGGSVNWACDAREAQRRLAFVFQTPVVLRRSVLENVIYPLRIVGRPREEALALGREWCTRIGLGEATDRSATVLSRGEKQKLALARALITRPDALFLDEPCASLDGSATREIEALLQTASDEGTRLILATHDMGQARRLANDVIFLLRSKVHETGTAPAFFDGPRTAQARAFLAGDIVE